MRLSSFTVFQPESLKEALSLRQRYKEEALLKAGGTSLIPEIRLGLKKPGYVIILDSVEETGGIEEKADDLHIGATASLQTIKKSGVVRDRYGALAEAIETVSAPSLHYQSTIGGNICQDTRCIYYDQSGFWRGIKGACFKQGGDRCHAVPASKGCHSVYQGDLAPILICMDAAVCVSTLKKDKIVKLVDLFSGNGLSPLRLPANSIVTRIIIPPVTTKKLGYEKFSERGALDYPLVGVAACIRMDNGVVAENRFVATAVGSAPVVVSEPLLNGRSFDEEFIASAAEAVFKKARPVANTSAAPVYRRQMARTMVEKVLRRLMS